MSPKLAVVLGLALFVVIGFAFHWWILDIRRIWDWLVYAEPADLPGRDMPATAGEHHPDPDMFDRLDPDEAADILIAEWHDGSLRGYTWCFSHQHAAPCPTCDDEFVLDWPASPDVWDAWWAGMDGLERECLKVTRARQREQQLWAELKAETRELCGVAA